MKLFLSLFLLWTASAQANLESAKSLCDGLEKVTNEPSYRLLSTEEKNRVWDEAFAQLVQTEDAKARFATAAAEEAGKPRIKAMRKIFYSYAPRGWTCDAFDRRYPKQKR